VDACCGGAAPQQPRTAGKCCRLSARARAGLGRHGGVADAGRGGRCGGARARQVRKRIAVAAEALASAADVNIVDVPKSDAVLALLGARPWRDPT